MIRKTLFWCHLTLGVTAGTLIFTMSVTGVLLAFQRQLIAWAERDQRVAPAAARLPLSQLVTAASQSKPKGHPSAVTAYSDPASPVLVRFGREGALAVDPYRGTVLGAGATKTRAFFRFVEDVHRWLALEDEARTKSKAAMGAANLLFFFIVLSGPVLWWPRNGAFRNVAWFRGGLRGRTRDFNWHNVLGIWSALPLAAIVFSGIVISYSWAGTLVYRAFGDRPPAPDRTAPPRGKRSEAPLDRIWPAAVAEAGRVAPDWRSLTLRLPIGDRATLTVDRGNGARPDKRSELIFDAKTAQLIRHDTFQSQTGGRKARSWLRWIHTGEAGGIGGQVIAAVASSAAAVLVWTGIALALRRFRGWRRRKELAR